MINIEEEGSTWRGPLAGYAKDAVLQLMEGSYSCFGTHPLYSGPVAPTHGGPNAAPIRPGPELKTLSHMISGRN